MPAPTRARLLCAEASSAVTLHGTSAGSLSAALNASGADISRAADLAIAFARGREYSRLGDRPSSGETS